MTNHADKLAYWSQHRQAWQASGLTRQAYCEREGLSFVSGRRIHLSIHNPNAVHSPAFNNG